MSDNWYDWNSSDSMEDGWKYRIKKEETDDEQAGLQWNGRVVEVETPEEKRERFVVFGKHDEISGPYIQLELLLLPNWCLREEIRDALATAVSLSVQPLVKWRDNE
jgi:hypothetical protein